METAAPQDGKEDAPFPLTMIVSGFAPVSATGWTDEMSHSVDLLMQHERERASGRRIQGPTEAPVSWLDRECVLTSPRSEGAFVELATDTFLSGIEADDIYQQAHDAITLLRPCGDGSFLSSLTCQLKWPGIYGGRQRDWTCFFSEMSNDVRYNSNSEIAFFLAAYAMLTGAQRVDMVKDSDTFHQERLEAMRKQLAEARKAKVTIDLKEPNAASESCLIDADSQGEGDDLESTWLSEIRQPGNPLPGNCTAAKLIACRLMRHMKTANPSENNCTQAHVGDRKTATAAMVIVAAAAEHDLEFPGQTSFMALLPKLPLTHEDAVDFVLQEHNVLHPITKAQRAKKEEIVAALLKRRGKTGILSSAGAVRQARFPWRCGRTPRSRQRMESLSKDVNDLLQIAFEKKLFPALATIATSAYFRVKFLRKPTPLYLLQMTEVAMPVLIRPEHLIPVKKLQPTDYAQRQVRVALSGGEDGIGHSSACHVPLVDSAALVAKSSSALDGVDVEATELNTLPFSLGHQAVAHSHSGKQFLSRMQTDLVKSKPPAAVQDTLAAIAANDVASHLVAAAVTPSFSSLDAQLSEDLRIKVPVLLRDLFKAVQAMSDTLHTSQQETWRAARSLSERVANAGVEDASENAAFTVFEVQRWAGQINVARLSFILGCILSTCATEDLRRLNPFIDEARAAGFVTDSIALMMQSVRASQAAQAMVELKGVLALTQEAVVEITTALTMPELSSCVEHVLLPESVFLSACHHCEYDVPASVQLVLKTALALGAAAESLHRGGLSKVDADSAVMLWTCVTSFEESLRTYI
jgi:hypothetical protein